MPNGNINFGLAHGLIGVLIVLAKFSGWGHYNEGINTAISAIFDLYERFIYEDNSVLRFPTQLPFEHVRLQKAYNAE